MGRPNIILTGFMATGKTTVGQLIAKHLAYEFVDTDSLIVQREGMSVQKIFQTRGEPEFRRMESTLARELAEHQGRVVSTGGGMLVDPGNAKILGQTGLIFCLVATAQEIFDRVAKDTRAKRPLLSSPDPMAEVRRLMAQREAAYKNFTQIDTTGKDPKAVAREVMEMIRADSAVVS